MLKIFDTSMWRAASLRINLCKAVPDLQLNFGEDVSMIEKVFCSCASQAVSYCMCIMQEALEAHQRYFVWDVVEDKGIFGSIERELALRAAAVTDAPLSVFS